MQAAMVSAIYLKNAQSLSEKVCQCEIYAYLSGTLVFLSSVYLSVIFGMFQSSGFCFLTGATSNGSL